jgi:leucyl-tRNA synthetase
MILAEDGQKMSKSRGNVINPDDVVREFGADTLRLYIMFIGDFEKDAPWSTSSVKGCKRFLDRVWNLCEKPLQSKGFEYSTENEKAVHRAIKKVGGDIEAVKFNTAIATLMSLVNDFYESPPSRGDIRALLSLLSPFAPHITEELWKIQGFPGSAAADKWPEYDEAKTLDDEREIAVQIGGKLKGTIIIPSGSDDDFVLSAALSDEKISRLVEGREIARSIVVKDRLINLILR